MSNYNEYEDMDYLYSLVSGSLVNNNKKLKEQKGIVEDLKVINEELSEKEKVRLDNLKKEVEEYIDKSVKVYEDSVIKDLKLLEKTHSLIEKSYEEYVKEKAFRLEKELAQKKFFKIPTHASIEAKTDKLLRDPESFLDWNKMYTYFEEYEVTRGYKETPLSINLIFGGNTFNISKEPTVNVYGGHINNRSLKFYALNLEKDGIHFYNPWDGISHGIIGDRQEHNDVGFVLETSQEVHPKWSEEASKLITLEKDNLILKRILETILGCESKVYLPKDKVSVINKYWETEES